MIGCYPPYVPYLYSLHTDHPSLPTIPVITAPMLSDILWRCDTLFGSNSLSGTFFCVITAAHSFPLTPMEVMPPWLIALKAYSVR